MKRAQASLSVLVLAALPVVVCHGQRWRTTEMVSVSSSGEQGNHYSYAPSVSADGRFVAFHSGASNLVPADPDGKPDVFLRDRLLGITELVSVCSGGEKGNGPSEYPSISADGRFVAFSSDASNLVPGDTNGQRDVFVRDRLLQATERVSVSSLGDQANGWSASGHASMSADGRFVAFQSAASNLVPGDMNGMRDIFLRDRLLQTTARVSVSSLSEEGGRHSYGASISADARFVGFSSDASNLVPGDTNGQRDVFVRDQLLQTTELVSVSSLGEQGNGSSSGVSISGDGRLVAFSSISSNLVPGDTNGKWDVFVRDRLLGMTERVSVSSLGEQGNGLSSAATLSANGRYVAFNSESSNLVPGDTNGYPDVFLRDLLLGTTERVGLSWRGEQAIWGAESPSVTADGGLVAFESGSHNLLPWYTSFRQIFVARPTEERRVSGKVRFGHLSQGTRAPSAVVMRITPEGGWEYEETVMLGPDGSYSVTLAECRHQLSVKHTHWLRRAIAVDPSYGNVENADLHLENGDAYEDNAVTIKDLNKILYLFGVQDGLADLDEDGIVTLADLTIVLVNFGMYGDF